MPNYPTASNLGDRPIPTAGYSRAVAVYRPAARPPVAGLPGVYVVAKTAQKQRKIGPETVLGAENVYRGSSNPSPMRLSGVYTAAGLIWACCRADCHADCHAHCHAHCHVHCHACCHGRCHHRCHRVLPRRGNGHAAQRPGVVRAGGSDGLSNQVCVYTDSAIAFCHVICLPFCQPFLCTVLTVDLALEMPPTAEWSLLACVTVASAVPGAWPPAEQPSCGDTGGTPAPSTRPPCGGATWPEYDRMPDRRALPSGRSR